MSATPAETATPSETAAATSSPAPTLAAAAAKSFVSGYLDYLYGRATLETIPDVTATVRNVLPKTLYYVLAEQRPQ